MIDNEKLSPVPPDMQDEWVSRQEAANLLRVHADTVTKMVRDGVLNSVRYGKHSLISRESIKKYLGQFRHVSR